MNIPSVMVVANFPPAGGSGSIVKNAPVVNWDGKLVEDNTQVNKIALGF